MLQITAQGALNMCRQGRMSAWILRGLRDAAFERGRHPRMICGTSRCGSIAAQSPFAPHLTGLALCLRKVAEIQANIEQDGHESIPATFWAVVPAST